MYNNSLHRERKHFCRYFLQAFCIEKIVKSHIKDCFKINDKQKIINLKNMNLLNSKIMKEK